MPRITRPEDLFHPTPSHPVETIANLDAIPIRENGEPLVDIATTCPTLLVRPLGPSSKKAALMCRAEVARRLTMAQDYLDANSPGYQLIVVDGWRSVGQQTRAHYIARGLFRILHPLWPGSLIREAANKYVAAPDAVAPPPHSTGGAIDFRLRSTKTGKTINLVSWPMSASRTDYEKISPEAKQNRAILGAALTHAGFSNYEEEWWHWSYGDSGWALRSNQPMAIYGQISRTSTPILSKV